MVMKTFNVGDVLAAGDLNEFAVNTIISAKGSDTSRASNTTLTTDPDLAATVGASKIYEVDARIIYTAVNATGDLKYSFTVPAGAIFTGTSLGTLVGGSLTLAAYQAGGLLITATQTVAGGGGVQQPLLFSGTLATSSTAGVLAFTWAQSTSNATPTVLKQGSSLVLRRVS